MDVTTAVREVFASVRQNGRVTHEAVTRLREAVRRQRQHGGEPSVQEMVSGLPPFDALPTEVQQKLYATVLRDDWWSMRLRRAGWRQAFARTARSAALKLPDRYQRLRRALDLSEALFLLWHARLLHEAYRASLLLRGWTGREPILPAALRIAGLDARAIAASYLRRTPQAIETAAYWHDPARHKTVGVVIGIDFIVNDEGVWFVESNLNVGLIEERSELYVTDPFVENIVQFARDNGYRSILYLACNDYSVDNIMATRLERAALDAGLQGTIIEDRYAPHRQYAQSFLVPPLGDHTLVVRGKMFHTTLDALFHNKTVTLEAIEAYQERTGDNAVRLPPRVESLPDRLPVSGPFPNLVYKFPERDQGQGVIFLKAASVTRARAILADRVEMNRHSVANVWTKLRYQLKLEDQAGIFQSYIPSSLLEGRRLAVARAHVLATPVGNVFLSAHRIVSNNAVPESLPEGLVVNATPYIVNYSLDASHAAMPEDEEERVRRAALSVVRALCDAVETRYETRPGGA